MAKIDFPRSGVPFSQIVYFDVHTAQYFELDAMTIEKHAADDRLSMRTVAAYGRLYEPSTHSAGKRVTILTSSSIPVSPRTAFGSNAWASPCRVP